jgi:hypothetical protein
MTTTRHDASRQVLEENPDLSANGFRFTESRFQPEMPPAEFERYREALVSPAGLKQIETACEYFGLFGPTPRNWSYGLKHDMERWGQSVGLAGYVSNGSAIVAAILCGYGIKREQNSPNCVVTSGCTHADRLDQKTKPRA